MKAREVRPTGRELTFSDDEIIVSKTDVKGVITYANDVFVRISGYGHDELIGQPHSLIRHPEMPRGVFALMWDTISAGQELFAYVNNLAAGGDHYWVLAHVTPTFDAAQRIRGYHSNRRRPEPSAVREIDAVYAQMRGIEKRHGGRGIDAARASRDWLQEHLTDRDQTYEEFVWDLIGRSSAMAGAQ